MNKLVLLIFALAFTSPVLASAESKEEPVQHLKIADVTSMERARKIFISRTSDIKKKKKLDMTELNQIHLITYSLEKSVAFFVANLKKERQKLAKEIAVVVEAIHINSENNRKEKTRQYLAKYFILAEKFISGF